MVDLITNSSSETYVQASDKTVKALKDLVNLFLAGTGTNCAAILDIKMVEGDECTTNKIEVTAKDPKHEQTAKVMKRLVESFETVEIMC